MITDIVTAVSNEVIGLLAAGGYPPLVDGKILLGRQHQFENSSPPRVVFTPMRSIYSAKDLTNGNRTVTLGQKYSAEAKAQILQRSLGTDGIVFEVRCWGVTTDQTDPQAVPDDNIDFTEQLVHFVLQAIQRQMPGVPVVMGNTGEWTGASIHSTQQDVFGSEFVFTTNPIPTPILGDLLQFVPPGTTSATTTYFEPPGGTPELGCTG